MPAGDLAKRAWEQLWERHKHEPDVFLTLAYKRYEESRIAYEKGDSQYINNARMKAIDKWLPIAEEYKLALDARTDEPRRIFFCGDIHGGHDIHCLNTFHFPEQNQLTKRDIMIFLGDWGLIYDPAESGKEELYWTDWLTTRPYTSVVVLGNHENYDRVNMLPQTEMFGGPVWVVNESIVILERGRVYDIDGMTFFTMGGAFSIDRNYRVLNVSWWEYEIPSGREFTRGFKELDDHNWEVDYVITHTTSDDLIEEYADTEDNKLLFGGKINDPVARYLSNVFEKLKFKKHFFGHFHDCWTSSDGKHIMLYRKVVELEKETDRSSTEEERGGDDINSPKVP